MAKEKKVETSDDTLKPPSDREQRWAAFLERARKVNPVRFDRQKANHEFDSIPDNWNE